MQFGPGANTGVGLGVITYDWRQCPADLPPPQGPAYYGPLAADVGTRSFGEFEPAPDVELENCPPGPRLAEGGGILLLGLAFLVMIGTGRGRKS